MELSESDYLESVLNLTLFGTDYSFKRLRKPVNKTDWISHGRPAIVNAFYSALENSIRKFLICSFHFVLQLEIEPTLFLEAYLNCSLFYWHVMSKQLKEPVNKTDWRAHGAPTTVNAYYADYENSIRKLDVWCVQNISLYNKFIAFRLNLTIQIFLKKLKF